MGKKKKALRAAAEREHDAHGPARALAAMGAMRALAPIAKATDEPPLLALGLGTLAIGEAGAVNAALLAAAILGLSDPALAARLSAWREAQTAGVAARPS